MFGVWCLRFGVWCLVFEIWCLVFGVWCLRFEVWCLVFEVWGLVFGDWLATLPLGVRAEEVWGLGGRGLGVGPLELSDWLEVLAFAATTGSSACTVSYSAYNPPTGSPPGAGVCLVPDAEPGCWGVSAPPSM